MLFPELQYGTIQHYLVHNNKSHNIHIYISFFIQYQYAGIFIVWMSHNIFMLKCNIKKIGFLFSFSQNFGTCPNFMKCIFRNIYILIDLHMLKCNINKIWLLFNFSQTFGTLSKFYEMLLTQEKVTLCLVS